MATPFPRLTYDEAMARFGTDKPDIRYGMELADVTDLGPTCDFAVFRNVIACGRTDTRLRCTGRRGLYSPRNR